MEKQVISDAFIVWFCSTRAYPCTWCAERCVRGKEDGLGKKWGNVFRARGIFGEVGCGSCKDGCNGGCTPAPSLHPCNPPMWTHHAAGVSRGFSKVPKGGKHPSISAPMLKGLSLPSSFPFFFACPCCIPQVWGAGQASKTLLPAPARLLGVWA